VFLNSSGFLVIFLIWQKKAAKVQIVAEDGDEEDDAPAKPNPKVKRLTYQGYVYIYTYIYF